MNAWTLQGITDRPAVTRLLSEHGVSRGAAPGKAEMLARAARKLLADGHRPSTATAGCFVPGRIEVLGKHTDYAGGRSLICAAERGFCALAVARSDAHISVLDAGRNERVLFALEPELQPTEGHWANYPITVARRLARNFSGPWRGLDLVFESDLPPAAGMSSSSAMIVMTYLLIARFNRLGEQPAFADNIHSRHDLAGYLGTIENGQTFGTLKGDRGVGTFGGSEDHTAILCCRPAHLALYSYCPVRHEQDVPLPADHVIAVGVSGVVAEKTGAAMALYNRAAARARAVTQAWNQATGGEQPHLGAIVATSADAAERVRSVLGEYRDAQFTAHELVDRFDQFVAESETIIPNAVRALQQCDWVGFGRQVRRSQQLGARLLGNQIPRTEFLAAEAERQGAMAASAFGAGFGGSVWALVAAADATGFLAQWRDAYLAAFPDQPAQVDFFLTRPGPSAIEFG